MSGIERHAGDGSSASPSSSRTPRMPFPTTRARPTSIVDTTTTSVETTAEAILSTSPASSITSIGASPRKHTQSAADRLASAQAKDAAAAAKSHRTRTTSSTSRSSGEGGRPKLPSLLQATTTARPAASTSLDVSSSSKLDETTAQTTSTPRAATPARDPEAQTMSRRGSRDHPSPPSSKVAGPSTPKKTTPATIATPPAPPLVALLSDSNASKLIKQGAEAKVYISRIATNNILSWPQPRSSQLEAIKVEPPADVLLKWRFPKMYRHPTLSSSITASRTIMEARALLRCSKAGVAVPAVRCVDEKEGILGLELIPGRSVREWLGGGAEGEDETIIDAEEHDEEVLSENDQVKLMHLIGKQLAIMHEADIIHGDLTTSNMMLRPASDGKAKVDCERDEVVLIDFGLSSVSAFAEDKAVDLYVLERAFASTHPASEGLFRTILDSYAEVVTARSAGKSRGKGGKLGRWEETRRKLEEVRMRGRKRSMVGSELWKDNYNRRLVVNFELSLTLECHGVIDALRSLPGLTRGLLRLRPSDAFNLLRPNRTQRDGEWHALASRMDTELDRIGSTRLLAEHTPHESARTAPRSGVLVTLPVVGFTTNVWRDVPLARQVETVVERVLETVAVGVERVLTEVAPQVVARKSKTD